MKLFFSAILKNLKELSDPRNLPYVPMELFRYLIDLKRFKSQYNGKYPIKVTPIFFERTAFSSFDPHYVYQAYWATARILQNKNIGPHVDISSNVSFLAQLSACRNVVQLEYRPPELRLTACSRVSGDILRLPFFKRSIGSVSCLHVIEHVGLGRYGDPLDVTGAWKGLLELERIIAPGGFLYLSVPVGKPSVLFNSGYIFSPMDILRALSRLKLIEFSYVDDDKNFIEYSKPEDASELKYGLGLFLFRKLK